MNLSNVNLPNALTLSRIILIPIFVIFFYLPVSWHYTAACMIFILAAITDGLDGYYARKLGQTSALGACLGPVADNLMIACVLVMLVEYDTSIWFGFPADVIIGR